MYVNSSLSSISDVRFLIARMRVVLSIQQMLSVKCQLKDKKKTTIELGVVYEISFTHIFFAILRVDPILLKQMSSVSMADDAPMDTVDAVESLASSTTTTEGCKLRPGLPLPKLPKPLISGNLNDFLGPWELKFVTEMELDHFTQVLNQVSLYATIKDENTVRLFI